MGIYLIIYETYNSYLIDCDWIYLHEEDVSYKLIFWIFYFFSNGLRCKYIQMPFLLKKDKSLLFLEVSLELLIPSCSFELFFRY